jgi:starch-binding outer membrane protein, SusD/RagB family
MKSIKINQKFFALTLVSAFSIGLMVASCKKFIEVPPPSTSLNGSNVYESDATAAAVLTDLYAEMSNQNSTAGPSASLAAYSWIGGLSADELSLYYTGYNAFFSYYTNDLNSQTSPSYWNGTYPNIFIVNTAIEGVTKSTSLTPAVKNHLLGEAKFMRAFYYFYLVNFYGDVPLILSTDYKLNMKMGRTASNVVFQQIIKDLKEAQMLMNENFLKGDIVSLYALGSEERVRPTKWAATALLSRVYLYNRDWSLAEAEATKVINNSALFTLETLSNAFKKNNKEAIWQLQPVGNNTNSNTGDGKLYILPAGGPTNTITNPVHLSKSVVNAFEVNDQRKTNWVDSVKPSSVAYYFAKKYKVGNVIASTSEYITVLRLAEQYLVRAEARAEQDNIVGARDDLFAIRRRAGLLDATLTANDKSSLLSVIIHERQVELFTEWGHRWLDLKRTGNLDAIMNTVAIQKGGIWNPTRGLYPIPQTEIDRNPSIIQNSGY